MKINKELINDSSDEDLFAVEKYKEYLEEKRDHELQESEWNKTDWGSTR